MSQKIFQTQPEFTKIPQKFSSNQSDNFQKSFIEQSNFEKIKNDIEQSNKEIASLLKYVESNRDSSAHEICDFIKKEIDQVTGNLNKLDLEIQKNDNLSEQFLVLRDYVFKNRHEIDQYSKSISQIEQNKIYRDKTRKNIKIESGKTFSQPQGSNFCYLVSTINHIASLEDKSLLKKINSRFKIGNDQITFTFDNPGIQELKENGVIRTVGKAPYKEAISIKFADFPRFGLDPNHANFPANVLIEMWKKFCVNNPHLKVNVKPATDASGAIKYYDQFYTVKGFLEKIGLEAAPTPQINEDSVFQNLVNDNQNNQENQESSLEKAQEILNLNNYLSPQVKETFLKKLNNQDLSDYEQSSIGEALTNGTFSEKEYSIISGILFQYDDISRQEQLSAVSLPLPNKEGNYIVLRDSHYVCCVVYKNAVGALMVKELNSLRLDNQIIPYNEYSKCNNDVIVIKEKTQAIR